MTVAAKVVLIGPAGAGKSAILERLASNVFREDSLPTIGAAYASISLSKNPQHLIGVWDTAGQERYSALAPMYYRNSNAALIVFDSTCRKSYSRALQWVTTIRESYPSIIIALTSAKIDLANTREIPSIELKDTASRLSVPYLEVSAKTSEGMASLISFLRDTADKVELRHSFPLPSPEPTRLSLASCC
jgi:small GTP-binding protein